MAGFAGTLNCSSSTRSMPTAPPGCCALPLLSTALPVPDHEGVVRRAGGDVRRLRREDELRRGDEREQPVEHLALPARVQVLLHLVDHHDAVAGRTQRDLA